MGKKNNQKKKAGAAANTNDPDALKVSIKMFRKL